MFWASGIDMIPLEAASDATNVKATIALSTSDGTLAPPQVMVETDGQPPGRDWHPIGKLSRHTNITFTLTFPLTFSATLQTPAVIIGPRSRAQRSWRRQRQGLQQVSDIVARHGVTPDAIDWSPGSHSLNPLACPISSFNKNLPVSLDELLERDTGILVWRIAKTSLKQSLRPTLMLSEA